MINKAFIFAGGLGTRLRPYTNVTPKPMTILYDKPILEYTFRWMQIIGISHITINTFHLAEKFDILPEIAKNYDIDLKINKQDKLLMHAGDLNMANDFWNTLDDNENFLALNGDTIFFVEKDELFKYDNKINESSPMLLFGFDTETNPLTINENKVVGAGKRFYDMSFIH